MVTVNSTRKKDYSAPPEVRKNSGGYISTVYINKRRVYGPLRQTLEESVRDREQMLLAKERGASEDEIRDLVITMKRLHPSPSPVRRPNSKRARSASTTATAAAKAVAEYGMDGLVASYEMDVSLFCINMKSLLVLTILLIVSTTAVVRNDGFLKPNDVDKFNSKLKHTAQIDALKDHYKSDDFHGGPSGDGGYAGGGGF
ncbi:hypothetical protein FOZ60_000701 [Perkinsus olseni]|uniref:Uncharacterized protein n=1 Tax=Perkinsus olseni TaxID=32597 RepID=A0A7J6P1S3_PEROL|nr:hypothetical protein FOZ60_000701 [Perkinsus olseni]